ncbi:MAG TPA: hypothetical protein VG965_03840 [Patescibacteria group bacterium]|nr:hypothetical protein [Patescibacteria group bacterium]
MAVSEMVRGIVTKENAAFGAGIIAASALGLSAGHVAPSVVTDLYHDAFPTTEVTRSAYVLDQYKNQDSKEQTQTLIHDYRSQRTALVALYDWNIPTTRSKTERNAVKQQRINTTLEGAGILQRLPYDKTIRIDSHSKTVEIGDISLDLNNTYQLFLADGIISNSLTVQDQNSAVTVQMEAYLRLQNTLWLAKQKLPIKFDKFAFALPPDDLLLNIARMYRKMEELNYPIGKTHFTTKRMGSAAGNYHARIDLPQVGRIFGGFIDINNEASSVTISHENAHYQADVNREVKQATFDSSVLKFDSGLTDKEKEEARVSKYANTDDKEDYAETIEYYFTNGEEFRRKLTKLRLDDSSSYAGLKARYDFAKAFFKDEEYVGDGNIFYPKPGDVYQVMKPDDDKVTHIDLWDDPATIGIGGQSVDTVNEYEDLRIIEGPVEITTDSGDQVYAVKVRKGVFKAEDYSFTDSPYQLKDGAWIVANYFLGSKLTPIGSPKITEYTGIYGPAH